ncbi:hypothetical protein NDU88_001252 [Pleurodeles waltl]|uniref:Uncharacterized protein n=1 Tax=Pleurodeles waltl TaxID=8319 RepID=A0AAV7P383_PLEWA|nr:hypothetical protein NDU88_001252 [Pleurodeles waltl]
MEKSVGEPVVKMLCCVNVSGVPQGRSGAFGIYFWHAAEIGYPEPWVLRVLEECRRHDIAGYDYLRWSPLCELVVGIPGMGVVLRHTLYWQQPAAEEAGPGHKWCPLRTCL